MSGALVRTRPSSPQDFAQRRPRYHENFDGEDGTILPSVEGPDGSYIPPRPRQNPFDRQPEPRETNIGRQEGNNPRDAGFVDLTNSQTPKRRRLEGVAPQPEQRLYRQPSPARAMEYQYTAQTQPRDTRSDLRRAEYGEPRPSPQLHHAGHVREDAFVHRQPFHDARDALRPVARVYETVPGPHQLRETATMQPRYRAENYAAVSRNDVQPILPVRDLREQPSIPTSRTYEPIVESHVFDSRFVREEDMPLREQYVQRVPQDVRVRYIYADEPSAREKLQPLPQRALEYERSAAPMRSYAR